MARLTQSVKVDLRPLNRFRATLDAQLRRGRGGPIADALTQWAVRVRSFLQQRFVRESTGGGTWPPLAPSTLIARARRPVSRLNDALEAGEISDRQYEKRVRAAASKKARDIAKVRSGAGRYAILRDTGTLFAALSPHFTRRPGQLQERIPFGVRIGYGGPHQHPSAAGTNRRVTIADIASFHQQGAGVPRREIIVTPDPTVVAAMARDMDRAVARVIRGV